MGKFGRKVKVFKDKRFVAGKKAENGKKEAVKNCASGDGNGLTTPVTVKLDYQKRDDGSTRCSRADVIRDTCTGAGKKAKSRKRSRSCAPNQLRRFARFCVNGVTACFRGQQDTDEIIRKPNKTAKCKPIQSFNSTGQCLANEHVSTNSPKVTLQHENLYSGGDNVLLVHNQSPKDTEMQPLLSLAIASLKPSLESEQVFPSAVKSFPVCSTHPQPSPGQPIQDSHPSTIQLCCNELSGKKHMSPKKECTTSPIGHITQSRSPKANAPHIVHTTTNVTVGFHVPTSPVLNKRDSEQGRHVKPMKASRPSLLSMRLEAMDAGLPVPSTLPKTEALHPRPPLTRSKVSNVGAELMTELSAVKSSGSKISNDLAALRSTIQELWVDFYCLESDWLI